MGQTSTARGYVWKDGDKGWRWTTADGRFDSKLYRSRLEAEQARDNGPRRV